MAKIDRQPAGGGGVTLPIAESDVTSLVADLAAKADALATAAALSGKQPLDSDLTAIAALAPADDAFIQRKSGAWVSRTVAQVGTDLAAVLQPLDSDLTAIAALAPANDDVVQRKAGAWVNRTIAQLLVDLVVAGAEKVANKNIAGGYVGLDGSGNASIPNDLTAVDLTSTATGAAWRSRGRWTTSMGATTTLASWVKGDWMVDDAGLLWYTVSDAAGTGTLAQVGGAYWRDDQFSIRNLADLTKIAKFSCADIATGQTRTYDLPNASGDMISFPFGRPVNRGEIPVITAFGQGVLGLGGADQVLRSDGTDAGYALHTAGAPIPRSGFWYEPGFGSIGGGFAPAVSSGTFLPIVFSKSGTIDALAVEVVTGGATSTVRLGVYDDGGIGVPTNRLVDAGTVASATSATVVSITGLSVPVVAWRIYYLAVFAQGGTPPTVRNNSGPSPYMPTGNATPGTGTTRPSGFSQSSVAGALPATATPVLVNSSNGVIRAWCRFA